MSLVKSDSVSRLRNWRFNRRLWLVCLCLGIGLIGCSSASLKEDIVKAVSIGTGAKVILECVQV